MFKQILISLTILSIIFAQQADHYNHQTAMSMLYYAKASYCDAQQILAWDGPTFTYHPQMEQITVIDNSKHNSQMYIGYDKEQNHIVAAFRGSSNIKNWITNMKFFKMAYPGCDKCEVHIGFYKAWLSIQQEVHNSYFALKKAHPTAKFVVTGHSLGATQAQLCALYFAEIGEQVDTLYHFGSPRVGNLNFAVHAHSLLSHNILVIHRRDPVPHLPKKIQGYRRVNTEVFYVGDQPEVYEWCATKSGEEHKKCSNKYYLDVKIGDHLNYLGVSTSCDDLKLQMEEIYE